jgi:hypothetical protein
VLRVVAGTFAKYKWRLVCFFNACPGACVREREFIEETEP